VTYGDRYAIGGEEAGRLLVLLPNYVEVLVTELVSGPAYFIAGTPSAAEEMVVVCR
jgi:hypothetical protein